MARTHLQLAALATAAVPNLQIVKSASFGNPNTGEFESALLVASDGRSLIIRVPRSELAEAEQSSDLVALRALGAGVRSRLPFTVSSYLGQAPVADTRAVVYEFVFGSKLSLTSIQNSPRLCNSIGRGIAAIHSIPTSVVADAGLPLQQPSGSAQRVQQLISNSFATGLVPTVLHERWQLSATNSRLWQFTPTVINGSLSADSFLVSDEELVGLLGWQTLSVGDPARDLSWVVGSGIESAAAAVLNSYARDLGIGEPEALAEDSPLILRARLYSELEVAKWLLHGVSAKSTSIVDDAVRMLGVLSERVEDAEHRPLTPKTEPVLTVDEVAEMLARSRPDSN